MVQKQRKEATVLKKLNHPHIIKLLDFEDLEDFIYIFEELCEESLLQVITRVNYFTEEETRALIKQLLSALEYCHSLDIIHRYPFTLYKKPYTFLRDIKLENILVNKTKTGYQLKLADFGEATVCSST